MENETEPINDGVNLDENMNIEEEDEDLINYSDGDDYDDNGDLIMGANTESCSICLRERSATILRPCCQLPLCQECLTKYLESKVMEGIVAIQCPGSDCDSRFKAYEISSTVNYDVRQKFHKFLIDALNNPTLKTCPRCGQELRVEEEELRNKRKEARKGGYPVTCQACALKWCFLCQAPWHEKVTCREYVLGDRMLRSWASQRGAANKQINAQRCPCCQTYIQRSGGCDSMMCSRCGSNFCYQCGTQFPTSKGRYSPWYRFFMGDHRQKWTPLGCSGLLWPRSPLPRKLLKGVVFAAKVLGTVLLPPLLLILALALLVAAGPVFVGLKVYPKVRPYLQRFLRAKGDFLSVLSMIGYRKVFLVCFFLLAVTGILCLMLYLICLLLSWLLMNLLL